MPARRPLLRFRRLCLALVLALGPVPALAQGAEVAFAGLRQDPSLPVEITADSLAVDQTAKTALFTGKVVAVQGELRLEAAEVRVEYRADGRGIERLTATGGVTLATAADAAQSREAVYAVGSGEMVMTGDVLLTQGQSAISGQRLVMDLRAGTGRMEGRVQTVFTPRPGAGGGPQGGGTGN